MNDLIEIDTTPRYRGVSALAKKLGVSHTHLSRVLHGERKPGKQLARKLARLGIRMHTEEADENQNN